MANCLLSIAAKTATGAALANATLTFTPLPGDKLRSQDGAVIWPDAVQVVCDAGGLGSVTLKTGDYVYQTTGPVGPVRGTISVPDLISATLDLLIATPSGSFELIDWTDFADLTQLGPPYASVTAGLGAVSDGTLFLALSGDTLAICRKVGGALIPVYLDI